MWWRRRYSIFDEMRRMQEEMDRLFDEFFRATRFPELPSTALARRGMIERSEYRMPLTDMWETDKEVIITMELPGVNKKDIDINIYDDGIEVKVERSEDRREEDEKKGMYRFERTYSGFYRYIPLPPNVNAEKAEASYNNGVLEVKIPKIIEEEKGKGRKLKIK
ncbi:MAG: Hsp20/alpha crystallin family protein [Candidatus Altiarchaeales archaeon]|nr:MAG: Hsp20/alpha crystallin family protein [Candidatus Altiarchaeales archaeon]